MFSKSELTAYFPPGTKSIKQTDPGMPGSVNLKFMDSEKIIDWWNRFIIVSAL